MCKPPLVDFSVTCRQMCPHVQLFTWGHTRKLWSWDSNSDLSDSKVMLLASALSPFKNPYRTMWKAYFVCDGYICCPSHGLPLLLLPPWFCIWKSPRCRSPKQALGKKWLWVSSWLQVVHDLEEVLANYGPWAKFGPLPIFVQPTH